LLWGEGNKARHEAKRQQGGGKGWGKGKRQEVEGRQVGYIV